MTFDSAYTGGNCASCSWVAAEGVITDSTPQDFADFVLLIDRALVLNPNLAAAWNASG